MRFSVLLSVYYKESYSAFCKSLDSIFTQTTCPDEVILVEDGLLGSDFGVTLFCMLRDSFMIQLC